MQMKKKQIIGMVVAAVLFIAIGVSSVLSNATANSLQEEYLSNLLTDTYYGYTFNPPMGEYIGIVDVVGTIEEQTATGPFDTPQSYQHISTLNYIEELMADSDNKGILLYVDSPGGTVYESEELYLKLQEYKERTGNPIWVYMAHYAASGGYMASSAGDVIYANPNTTTGSIGVIMSGYDMSGLYEKLGIRYYSITSGENKDGSRMTEEQMAIYQSQVDECYARFVEIVCEGRGMSEEEVRALADGRTYTAKQALGNGLIDQISLYDDMTYEMSSELGVYQFYSMETTSNFMSSLFSRLGSMMPKSDSQVLKETAAEMESGVLMYYAEQLR